MLRRPLPLALLIFALAEAAFLIRLSVPHKPVFDESHYVPAARMLMTLAAPANIEHPPLAKWLIGLGMRLFGDTPFGWRFAATIAGSVTITAVFSTVWQITHRLRPSLTATALTMLGFTVYIQARIAMLDGFMLAFLMSGIAMTAWTLRRGGWPRWIGASALLGCAVACKWIAAPYVAFAASAFVVFKREDQRRFPGLRAIPAIAALGAVSVAIYFLSFAPSFFYGFDPMTLAKLIPFQWEMYLKQTQILPPHTYQSNWWTWPLLIRPIWYLYEPADGAQRGILYIGNPVIMWGGLLAVAACWWGWVKTGSARLFAAASLWTGSLAIWAAIPKSLGFYYYYYPSSVFLVIALVLALDHWKRRGWDVALLVTAAITAVYFYPVLSAMPLSGPGAFHNWTWFKSWV